MWDAPEQRQVFSSPRMGWNEEQDILDIIGGAKERLLDAPNGPFRPFGVMPEGQLFFRSR